ncbi:unnamed protein product [Boreogadus saida]
MDPIENNDKMGRVGHAHGLYLLCSIKGHPCWALVDTGSTISIVRPVVLPQTGWTPTDSTSRGEDRVYTSPAVFTRCHTITAAIP